MFDFLTFIIGGKKMDQEKGNITVLEVTPDGYKKYAEGFKAIRILKDI